MNKTFQRKINVQISTANVSNDYEINCPTNGQLISMESMKATLTRGAYQNMIGTQTLPNYTALDTVDMISFFTVMTPQLVKDLNVKSLTDLDLIDSKPLIAIYRNQVSPWLLQLQTILSLNSEDE